MTRALTGPRACYHQPPRTHTFITRGPVSARVVVAHGRAGECSLSLQVFTVGRRRVFFWGGGTGRRIVPSRSSATETSRGAVTGTRQSAGHRGPGWRGCPWCRSPCPGSPPPPCRRAESRDVEVPGAQERLLGRAPPPPPGLSWADAGHSHFLPGPGPLPFPLPQLPLPMAGLASTGCPRGRRGAWTIEDSTFCSLCSWRVYPRCIGFFHPHLCPQGPALPRTPGFPSLSHTSLIKYLHPHSVLFIERLLSTGLWGPSGDTLLLLLELRVRRGKPATHSGQGGVGDGRWRGEVGRAPGGGWRRAQGGGSRGRPQPCRQLREDLRAGATAPSSWQPRRFPNTARRVGGAEHAGYTHPVWA